jgi:hypothetical protein
MWGSRKAQSYTTEIDEVFAEALEDEDVINVPDALALIQRYKAAFDEAKSSSASMMSLSFKS